MLAISCSTGYDKLKPFGFPVHGCICGYSRKIIWLEVDRSNNNPKVPARLYIDAVRKLGGCPRILRSDCGTENTILAAMQSYFRAEGNDEFAGTKAHQYVTSQSNQRIEAWWSFYKKSNSSWWINLFKDMSESGVLVLGNLFHMECLWFCFSKLLQKELDKVMDHWNSHYIRKSHCDTIAGVPDILYYLPENYGATDCLVPIPQAKINEVEPQCDMDVEDNTYMEYFEFIMETTGINYPCDVEEAFNLFQIFKNLQNNDG